ncbi:MAG: 3-hydroxylacyl-ACP dehydratase [Gammaproteobacteria bacterium]|nr:3-hydroxylacyl-ACP dehydratase [Gammaproteobacteria bacterium]
MSLNHKELCRLIPHHGSMCLLDSVVEWDETSIKCRAVSQCHPTNPLAENGVLSAINGVEYAAQAMAVHGALLQRDESTPEAAYLAALRGVKLHCEQLHDQPVLLLRCQRLGGDNNGFIYSFEVSNDVSLLLEGRATVIKPATTNATGQTA